MEIRAPAIPNPLRIRASLLGLALVLLLGGAAAAQEWTILGARAMGMGGAGVATARGGGATYWNPAALGRSQGEWGTSGFGEPAADSHVFDLAMGISAVAAAPGDTLREIDTLRQDIDTLNIDDIQARILGGNPPTPEELQAALRIAGRDLPALSQQGEGLLLEGIAGPQARIGRFGLDVLTQVHAGGSALVDTTNLGLGVPVGTFLGPGQDRSGQIGPAGQSLADSLAATGNLTQNQAEELVFQAEQGGVDPGNPGSRSSLTNLVNASSSGTNLITNNQTAVRVRGLFTEEVAVGYGQPLGDWLSVGAAAKGIYGVTYRKDYPVLDLPSTSQLARDLIHLKDTEDTLAFGLDAGALLTPTSWLAVGITGKNLNYPAFALRGGGHIVVDPSARAGAALFPVSWLTLAVDSDLYEISSEVLPGHHSQVVGGGAEFDLGIVALRAGISKNIADSDEDVVLHAGIAVRLWRFSLEAAAMGTPSLQTITADGTKVPERVGASLSMGLNIDF